VTDLLKTGLAWLEQQRVAHCSSPVEYQRGLDTVVVQATKGKTDYEVVDDYGATVGSHVVDFLIMADELGLKPEPGDVIVADGYKYEVMNLGGDGCWRFSDLNLITFRIHTKEIGPT